MNIAEIIRKRREELQLSQEQLAQAVGVSRRCVSNYECGARIPDAVLS